MTKDKELIWQSDGFTAIIPAMRVVLVSKALVVGAYQRKAEAIARLGSALGLELFVFVPPSWQDRRGSQVTQLRHTQGYSLQVLPLRFNGNYHLHYYPTLARELAVLHPHVVHMDEEPYNLATWLALRAAQRVGALSTFFTWQNIDRRYPLPFRWFEQQNYARAPLAIAGNHAASAVLRRKGYQGDIAIIPQFGVDPQTFKSSSPGAEAAMSPQRPLQIGYAGGLLLDKGLDLLLQACAQLHGDWHLHLAGQGEAATTLHQMARHLQIAHKITWVGQIDSDAMPAFYRQLDLFVLPSRTLSNWKEQFGRVLIEAMASEVAVIGSDSGEIPNVIDNAGLIFPEGDVDALRAHLQGLLDQRAVRDQLGRAGRQRVIDHYTMDAVATQTLAVYQQLYTLHMQPRAGRP